MKLIPLTFGKFAKVDDADFDRVNQFKWRYSIGSSNRESAVRTVRLPNGKRTTLHMSRFILPSKAERIDHWDGDGLNNQRHNLRPCTVPQNGQNRKLQKHSSKFKGVHKLKSGFGFQAKIAVNKRCIYLGCFQDEVQAAKRYDDAAVKFFGAFAKTNKELGAFNAVP